MFELLSRPCLDSRGIEQFTSLLSDQELDLNGTEKSTGYSLLLFLCHYNQSSAIYNHLNALLQTNRVEVNQRGNDMWNALSVVCFRHRGPRLFQVVKLLIKHGIIVNNTNMSGWNPLYALSSNANCEKNQLFDTIKVLVNARIKLNVKNKNNCHFLVPLTKNHHQNPDFEKIVRFLVSAELDINATNSSGKHICLAILEEIVGSSNISEGDLIKIEQLFIGLGMLPSLIRDDAVRILKNNGFKEDSKIMQLFLQ